LVPREPPRALPFDSGAPFGSLAAGKTAPGTNRHPTPDLQPCGGLAAPGTTTAYRTTPHPRRTAHRTHDP
ncbi:hypothetical protein ABZ665_36725, partial [Streptomyces sp. NPDC007049]|uniref:hypothetical protein n=1 Tax=Streptomyces sp. NPDC007049 TaxID=3156912 RepID=UPI0033DC64B1